MNDDVDKKVDEIMETFLMIDTEFRKRFGDFDMKDVMLSQSVKDVPKECVFPMDFKYEK